MSILRYFSTSSLPDATPCPAESLPRRLDTQQPTPSQRPGRAAGGATAERAAWPGARWGWGARVEASRGASAGPAAVGKGQLVHPTVKLRGTLSTLRDLVVRANYET